MKRVVPRRLRRVVSTRRVHRTMLRSLQRAPWDDATAMDELRTVRLRSLLDHAATHVPFQADRLRTAALNGSTVTSVDDLSVLPVTDKAQMRAAAADALWTDAPVEVMWTASSGTTGEPFRYAYDRWFDARTAAVRAWLYEQIGVPAGPVVESFRGLGVRRTRGSSSHHVHVLGYQTPIDEQISALDRIRPRVVYGNRSHLLRLAGAVADRDDLTVPRAVSTAELLSPDDRLRLRRELGAGVHDAYGLGEVGIVCAQADEALTARVIEPRIILEVLVDGRPARPGEVGEAVVTSLDNRVMPFIRYATGDLVRLAPDSAPSGRSGLLLEVVEGRTVDVPVDAQGRPVPWSDVGDRLWARPEIVDTVQAYQFVQEAPGHVRLLLVPHGAQVPPAVTIEIRDSVARALAGADVHIEQVRQLPDSTTGKHRPFVSKVEPTGDQPPPTPVEGRP